MYLEHFGLSLNPFSLSPKLEFLYKSDAFQESMAHLVYGVDNSEAITLITGAIGTGKTLSLQSFLTHLGPSFKTALVTNTRVNSVELLKLILEDLGIDLPPAGDKSDLLILFKDFLIKASNNGQRVLIIIDEAQNLPLEVLEEVRLLTNLGQGDQQPVQVILVGQPELERVINRPQLAQLRQRIRVHYRLSTLSRKEVGGYLNHRMMVAGNVDGVFKGKAVDRIFELSGGIPRLINAIAGNSLLAAYVAGRNKVEPEDVEMPSGVELPPMTADAPLPASATEDIPPAPAADSPLPGVEDVPLPPQSEEPGDTFDIGGEPLDAESAGDGGEPAFDIGGEPAPAAEPEAAPAAAPPPSPLSPPPPPPAHATRRSRSGQKKKRFPLGLVLGLLVVVLLGALYGLGYLDGALALVAGEDEDPATPAANQQVAGSGQVQESGSPARNPAGQGDGAESDQVQAVTDPAGSAEEPVELAESGAESGAESSSETTVSPPPAMEPEPQQASPEPEPEPERPAGNTYVHVASFRDGNRADLFLLSLRDEGHPGKILQQEVNNRTWFRVYAGPYFDRKDAMDHVDGLQKTARINYYQIVTLDQD
jgi:type II secretory pathway predicted ATPase ExeA/cell division septation protein DedD